MDWFDEQINKRKQNEQALFEETFIEIADSVMGTRISLTLNNNRKQTQNALNEIFKYYGIKLQGIPEDFEDINEQIEYLMRPFGIMRRTVNLSTGWYKDAIGVMLATKKSDGSITALVPSGITGYTYFDPIANKHIRINSKNEDLFETEALAFYKPFPQKMLNIASLMGYLMKALSISDFLLLAAATLAITLIGLLTPKLNNIIFSQVIENGSIQILLSVTVFMICVMISSTLMGAVKSLLTARIYTKMDIAVQSATMMRVLSLPAGFFKQYSSGELSSRSQNISSLCKMLVDAVLTSGLNSLFSLIYISQIFKYASALVLPAISIILVTLIFSVISTFAQMKINKKRMELTTKEAGMSYALISGVQKIKLSGSEKRAFARWGKLFTKTSELSYNPPLFLKINSVISIAISLTGIIVMYYMAVKSNVSVADYYAFNIAYGMVSGSFMALAGIALTIANIKPTMDMARPIMEAVPEVSLDKHVITKLSGTIEINNIHFRYNENMPPVLNNLSLKIPSGQYLAVVGTTGCGKSTLIRILLGFEQPQKGTVYYDGKDISTIDLKSLRRRIGVVMQNGKLFSGDIFSNITICAPWLSMDDAWKAAEIAGIEDDIREMPMGMHTIISEGSGGISGGQRQRLTIARAVAPKPKILIFDEATSALDNIAQKKVSEALDSLKCTRIIIAHRLSTIKHCDRIIVLNGGNIVEDGSYEELISRKGFFADLVERQRMDI